MIKLLIVIAAEGSLCAPILYLFTGHIAFAILSIVYMIAWIPLYPIAKRDWHL